MEPLGKDRAKRLAKLLTTKGRRLEGKILLDSKPLVTEGVNLGLVEELILCEGVEGAQIGKLAGNEIPVTPCSHEYFHKLCDVKSSFGVVAVANAPRLIDLVCDDCEVEKSRFVVYLDHIANPGNLGTIARSIAAFGCDLLVLSPDCADPYSPKSLRASAGALLRLQVAQGFLDPAHAWPTFFRAVARGGVQAAQLDVPQRRGLWLGNEAHGPRDGSEGLTLIDVTIPMDRKTESLNVTAAAAILSYTLGLSVR